MSIVGAHRREARSRQEFDHFVADSVDDLLRAAYLIAWDFAEAEDLVQECFLRVARRWPRVRGMEYPKAFARKVLVNLALDQSRRRSRHRAELHRMASDPLEEREDAAAALMFGTVDDGTDLMRALGDLPPRQRAALVLRYFEDLSEVQVAGVMGCSVGTVKSTTSRALERLRSAAPSVNGSGNDTDNRDSDTTCTAITKASEAVEGSVTE